MAIDASPSRIGTDRLETLCRRGQQQQRPRGTAERGHRSDPLEPGLALHSGRDPSTEPIPLNTSATVLVTFAVTGGSPTSSSAG